MPPQQSDGLLGGFGQILYLSAHGVVSAFCKGGTVTSVSRICKDNWLWVSVNTTCAGAYRAFDIGRG